MPQHICRSLTVFKARFAHLRGLSLLSLGAGDELCYSPVRWHKRLVIVIMAVSKPGKSIPDCAHMNMSNRLGWPDLTDLEATSPESIEVKGTTLVHKEGVSFENTLASLRGQGESETLGPCRRTISPRHTLNPPRSEKDGKEAKNLVQTLKTRAPGVSSQDLRTEANSLLLLSTTVDVHLTKDAEIDRCVEDTCLEHLLREPQPATNSSTGTGNPISFWFSAPTRSFFSCSFFVN